jgi:hypothetical protein
VTKKPRLLILDSGRFGAGQGIVNDGKESSRCDETVLQNEAVTLQGEIQNLAGRGGRPGSHLGQGQQEGCGDEAGEHDPNPILEVLGLGSFLFQRAEFGLGTRFLPARIEIPSPQTE